MRIRDGLKLIKRIFALIFNWISRYIKNYEAIINVIICLFPISIYLVGTLPSPPAPFIKVCVSVMGGGGGVFKIFQKSGGSDFCCKKGGVGKIGGINLKKGVITYFVTN